MASCNENENEKELKKGAWSPEEDQKLTAYIQQHGHGSWKALPAKAGLKRCGKSCRLRWKNYLRPNIKRGKFSVEEERSIIQLHALLGNRWSAIAGHVPMRTDSEIKNYWNAHLKKKLSKMGIDPTTHKPNTNPDPNLTHMAQWEAARIQAEARQSKPPPPCLDELKDTWTSQCRPHHQLSATAATSTLFSDHQNLVNALPTWAGQDSSMLWLGCMENPLCMGLVAPHDYDNESSGLQAEDDVIIEEKCWWRNPTACGPDDDIIKDGTLYSQITLHSDCSEHLLPHI